jgi:hypothetical protein
MKPTPPTTEGYALAEGGRTMHWAAGGRRAEKTFCGRKVTRVPGDTARAMTYATVKMCRTCLRRLEQL